MVAESDVQAAVKAGRVEVHKDTSTLRTPRVEGGTTGWGGTELTPYLVLLALLACVAEVFLANRIYPASGDPAAALPGSAPGKAQRRGMDT
jgi:hypothetical protein